MAGLAGGGGGAGEAVGDAAVGVAEQSVAAEGEGICAEEAEFVVPADCAVDDAADQTALRRAQQLVAGGALAAGGGGEAGDAVGDGGGAVGQAELGGGGEGGEGVAGGTGGGGGADCAVGDVADGLHAGPVAEGVPRIAARAGSRD